MLLKCSQSKIKPQHVIHIHTHTSSHTKVVPYLSVCFLAIPNKSPTLLVFRCGASQGCVYFMKDTIFYDMSI